MEVNGNDINEISEKLVHTTGDNPETNTAPMEILAEFLTLIMKKKYAQAMQHCKTILEYEPNNETVLAFIPLLTEKLKLIEEGETNEENDDNDDDSETENIFNNPNDDFDLDISDDEQYAINEGDTSSEITSMSPYNSSGSIESISSNDDNINQYNIDNEQEDNISNSISSNQSDNISNNMTNQSDISNNIYNISNSSDNIDNINIDISNGNYDISKQSKNNSSSYSSSTNTTNSSDIYFSLDNSTSGHTTESSSNNETSTTTQQIISSTTGSTKLFKQILNQTLVKTIENIKNKYGNENKIQQKNINQIFKK